MEKIYVDKAKGFYRYENIPELIIRDLASITMPGVKISLTEYTNKDGKIDYEACCDCGILGDVSVYRKTKKAAYKAYKAMVEKEFL